MLAMQVLARYDESCAVVRDQKLDPDLLTEQQKSPKAASMPLHQERVLVHRCAVHRSAVHRCAVTLLGPSDHASYQGLQHACECCLLEA